MSKASIIIVEDESIVAEDIRFTLENNGYEVPGVFASGEEVLRQVSRLKPDLILMDIKIEGDFDGIETARRMWEEHNIPIVFLTAHSDAATLDRAKGSRPFGYLLKPFEERELCVTVEIALSKRPEAPRLELPFSPWYGNCQLVLAAADFERDSDGLEPAARIHHRRQEQSSQLRLQAAEPEKWLDLMDDRTVDMLDILTVIWLQQAEQAESLVKVKADDFLSFRGLQQQKNGAGQRGGYEEKWRKDVAFQIEMLAHLQMLLPDRECPLLVLESDPESPYSWRLRPGDCLTQPFFRDERRTLLFSKRILEYDPYRQKWEKRLGRLLSWQWADAARQAGDPAPARVGDLLAELRLPIDQKNPVRNKERLELALETLRQDSVIGRWDYLDGDPAIVGKRGWLAVWMNWSLRVEPPLSLRQQYAGITAEGPRKPQAIAGRQQSFAFIRHIRAERGLTQMDVAAEIGITQAQLSQIEAGGKVQPVTANKIKAWILNWV